MTCMKNLRFSSRPRAKIRCQGPPGSARAQPCIQDYDMKGKERKTGLQTFSFFPMSNACLLFLIIAIFIEMLCSTKKHLFPSQGYYIYLLYKTFQVCWCEIRSKTQNTTIGSCTSLPSPPLLFIAFFTSHCSPLSEHLEQATTTSGTILFCSWRMIRRPR